MIEALLFILGASGGYLFTNELAKTDLDKQAFYYQNEIKDLKENKNVIKIGNKTVYKMTSLDKNNEFLKDNTQMCSLVKEDLEKAIDAVNSECK